MTEREIGEQTQGAVYHRHPWPWSMYGIVIMTAVLILLGVLAGLGY